MKKILSFDCHESLLKLFSNLDAEFYLLPYQNEHRWKDTFLPKNVHQIEGTFSDKFDAVLLFNRWWQYENAKGYDAPKFLQFATSRCNENDVAGLDEFLKRDDIKFAFCSHYQKMEYGMWHTESPVIYYGIDMSMYSGYKNKCGQVITAVKDFKERERVTRFSLWERLTKGIRSINYESLTKDKMVEAYQHSTIFLDTCIHSPLSFSVLEAMSVGMPVVTTFHDDLPLIIENGVNGVISNDEEYLKEKIKELMKNKKLRKRLGDNARQTIIEKFNIQQFVEKWSEYLCL
jgi:hypothetical protein